MPPRRPARSRRRTSSNGAGVACVVAAVALAAAMGVVAFRKGGAREVRTSHAPTPAAKPVVRVAAQHTAPPPKAAGPMEALAATVREVESAMPKLKSTSRGPAFETDRVALLARVSDARDQLGAYLDLHAGDDRASRLWDKVVRLYVALKKL